MEDKCTSLPFLSILARICIPATSVPSEQVFSPAGHVVSKLRASLSPENVDALLFLRQNVELIKPGQSDQVTAPRYCPEEVLCEEIEEAGEYSDYSQSESEDLSIIEVG